MDYYVAGALFTVLLLSIRMLGQYESEKWLWGKLALYFSTFLVSFNLSLNIGVFPIPILVLIVYRYLRRPVANKPVKKLALGFALVCFLLTNYMLPNISYAHLGLSRETYRAVQLFERVDSVQVFTPNMPIQKKFHNRDKGLDMSLATFAIDHEALPINEQALDDRVSLMQELINVYGFNRGIISTSVSSEVFLSFSYLGLDYYGIFDTRDGEPYLKYVIRGKLRGNSWPKLP